MPRDEREVATNKMSKFREALRKNLDVAIVEVDEHGYQTKTINQINKQDFIKSVKGYLRHDKDLFPYYSEVDIYLAVTDYLTEGGVQAS